jgi:hypothetical protein
MKAPKNLSHKPIVVINDYNELDGKNDASTTDAQAISIGKAQWNEEEMSAKVWRYVHTESKWSRQSEELPLHRLLDLSILLASLYKEDEHSVLNKSMKEIYDNDGYEDLLRFIKDNEMYLKPRLKELKKTLNEIEL